MAIGARLKRRRELLSSVAAGSIRKLRSHDLHRLCRHLLRLDAEDRRRRFGVSVNDDYIRGYCSHLRTRQSIVLGYFPDDEIRGSAQLSLFRNAFWSLSGEVALSVEGQLQNRGVGTALMRRLLVISRNRGVHDIHMLCLRDNPVMQTLAKKFGADLILHTSEVEGKLCPPLLSCLSIMEEILADSRAAFEWSRRF